LGTGLVSLSEYDGPRHHAHHPPRPASEHAAIVVLDGTAPLRSQVDRNNPPRDNHQMLRQRAPRVIAALAAVLLAASSVGASLAPRTTAADRCCRQEKRCQHEHARTIAPCCCAPAEAPAAGSTVPQVKAPPASTWTVVAAPVATSLAAVPALDLPAAHAPPHTPLFLQRCTLIL